MTVFDSTVWFALKGLGVRRLDVHFLYYGDHGVDVPSISNLISTEMAERCSLAEAALLRAITRFRVEATRGPHASAAPRARREPSTNQAVIDNQARTRDTLEHGIGHVDPARLERALGIVSQGFALTRTPAATEILTGRFLPYAALRRIQ